MNINESLETMKIIQNGLLEFIEEDDNANIDFQKLISIFIDKKICENRNNLKAVLHLVTKISNNHFRTSNFFEKIEQILTYFKNEIRHFYSNFEVFNIFKSNKRILLFLLSNKILIIDQYLADIIIYTKYFDLNYIEFFYPEMRKYITNDMIDQIFFENSIKHLELYEKMREKGENDNTICQFIRNDNIDDFITYTNQTNYPLSSVIPFSYFETNSLLIKMKTTTLIEYAAFYGSIQIFNYLIIQNVELTPSLWLYAIHSQKPEIIYVLEQNDIKPIDNNINQLLREAIKCHHNNIVFYIQENLINDSKCIQEQNELFTSIIKYHNYSFIQTSDINYTIFYDLCHYDYYNIVEILLRSGTFDLNAIKILSI